MLILTVSDDCLAGEECGNSSQRRWDKFLDNFKIAALRNQNLPCFDRTLKLTPISPLRARYPDALFIYTTDSV